MDRREQLIEMAKTAISTEETGAADAVDARWDLGQAAAEWVAGGFSDGALAIAVGRSRAFIQQSRTVWEKFHASPSRPRLTWQHYRHALHRGATEEDLAAAAAEQLTSEQFRLRLRASTTRDLERDLDALLRRVRSEFGRVSPPARPRIADRLARVETQLRLAIESGR